jgi:hypothetical protein
MVPELLEIRDFHSNNELFPPVMRALPLVKDSVHSPRQYYPDHEIIPIKDVVASQWRELVVEQDDDGTNRLNRLNDEVCTLQALREKVRVREIWIEGANRYRNPDHDLPTDWNSKRGTSYEALHQPTEADKFIEQVKEDNRRGTAFVGCGYATYTRQSAPAAQSEEETHEHHATGSPTGTTQFAEPQTGSEHPLAQYRFARYAQRNCAAHGLP